MNNELNTCPECGLFLWACKCKQPVETRIPTEKEILKYLNLEPLGLKPNEGFIGGSKAGWYAHKDRLKDFIDAQKVK